MPGGQAPAWGELGELRRGSGIAETFGVTAQGWLEKLPDSSSWGGSMKKRYFTATSGRLNWYAQLGDATPKGSVDDLKAYVLNITAVGLTFRLRPVAPEGKKDRVYVLTAPNEDELCMWIAALEQHCAAVEEQTVDQLGGAAAVARKTTVSGGHSGLEYDATVLAAVVADLGITGVGGRTALGSFASLWETAVCPALGANDPTGSGSEDPTGSGGDSSGAHWASSHSAESCSLLAAITNNALLKDQARKSCASSSSDSPSPPQAAAAGPDDGDSAAAAAYLHPLPPRAEALAQYQRQLQSTVQGSSTIAHCPPLPSQLLRTQSVEVTSQPSGSAMKLRRSESDSSAKLGSGTTTTTTTAGAGAAATLSAFEWVSQSFSKWTEALQNDTEKALLRRGLLTTSHIRACAVADSKVTEDGAGASEMAGLVGQLAAVAQDVGMTGFTFNLFGAKAMMLVPTPVDAAAAAASSSSSSSSAIEPSHCSSSPIEGHASEQGGAGGAGGGGVGAAAGGYVEGVMLAPAATTLRHYRPFTPEKEKRMIYRLRLNLCLARC